MSKIQLLKPSDMKKKDIVGRYNTLKMRHFDGHERTVYYTDKETTFPEGEQIASCADPSGHITHVNKAFMHMSGYTRDELIGMPHYILHHPDMPKIVFAEMWDSLQTTGRWEGYVKNLRKDGGFYWVHADVFVNRRGGEVVGYTSSRRSASREEIELYENKYRDLLEVERLGIL